jgi:hypothetical protein
MGPGGSDLVRNRSSMPLGIAPECLLGIPESPNQNGWSDRQPFLPDGGKGGDVIMKSSERHDEVVANGQEAEISSKESA